MCRRVIEELVFDDINQETGAKKNRSCKVFKDMPQGVVLQDECRHFQSEVEKNIFGYVRSQVVLRNFLRFISMNYR